MDALKKKKWAPKNHREIEKNEFKVDTKMIKTKSKRKTLMRIGSMITLEISLISDEEKKSYADFTRREFHLTYRR